MMEVVVELKPTAQWRPGLTYEWLVNEMDKALQFPGVTNAWTMPIKARIDMLTTGVRTPVGIKIFGPDLKQIEEIGKHIEMAVQDVPAHAASTLNASPVATSWTSRSNVRRLLAMG